MRPQTTEADSINEEREDIQIQTEGLVRKR